MQRYRSLEDIQVNNPMRLRLGPLKKPEFYRRFQKGEFGNRGVMWGSVKEARQSGFRGEFGIRTKGVGTRCDYNVPNDELESRIADFHQQGYTDDKINISAMMPDDKLHIQGEVQRQVAGLYLRYSTVKLPMRKALVEEEIHAHGLKANFILQQYCDPASYEWIIYLVDTYHIDVHCSSVVEFSIYSCPIGTLAEYGMNTLIWEVRNY